MQIRGPNAALSLAAEQSLRIESSTAVEIECLDGLLWVTQPGDVRDLFVVPGAPLRLLPSGLTLVTAVRSALLRVREVPADPSRRHWRRWPLRPEGTRASLAVLQVGPSQDTFPGL